MFKKGFVSRFSISNNNYDIALKSHLLSNSTVVLPANTILTTKMKDIIIENFDTLSNGEIAIAHGKDVNSLDKYIDKYPSFQRKLEVKELFRKMSEKNHKSEKDLVLVYDPNDTQKKFNQLMRQCAIDNKGKFAKLFSNQEFNTAIINYVGLFNLNEYFALIDTYIKNEQHNKKLKTHGMYSYNYFGSTSVGASNTFSLENSINFNYIEQGYQEDTKPLSGISILISNILDFVDGREEYDKISFLENEKNLSKLSYKDILEIRSTWLHSEIIEKYDQVVQECVNAYYKTSQLDSINKEVKIHLENAIELRQEILNSVKAKLKSEINLYKRTKFLRWATNLVLKRGITDNLELIDPALEIIDSAYDTVKYTQGLIKDSLTGITEVTAVAGKEEILKTLIKSKANKYEKSLEMIKINFSGDSVVYNYLLKIADRIKENHLEELK